MSHQIHLGKPALLEFSGPDAVRFLNGQLTQDVRAVIGSGRVLPSCVTDAKGKLQFRVWLREGADDCVIVQCSHGNAADLEARLTKYLIADDVEVVARTGEWRLIHVIGDTPEAPEDVTSIACNRYGINGTDWWIPSGSESAAPDSIPVLQGDELETFRIQHKAPEWGKELTEGILPPEAGLDPTDISYNKGCYIGQEVISRIKSAGKVNKTLQQISFDAALPCEGLELVSSSGKPAGEITSISPIADGNQRLALAYIKRNAEDVKLLSNGESHAVSIR